MLLHACARAHPLARRCSLATDCSHDPLRHRNYQLLFSPQGAAGLPHKAGTFSFSRSQGPSLLHLPFTRPHPYTRFLSTLLHLIPDPALPPVGQPIENWASLSSHSFVLDRGRCTNPSLELWRHRSRDVHSPRCAWDWCHQSLDSVEFVMVPCDHCLLDGTLGC